MGVLVSKSDVDSDQRETNKLIESMLQKEKEFREIQQKILLLGTAEAGKSTILKQMRLLHTDGFSKMEIMHQKYVIHNNMIRSMADILQAMPLLNIGFHNPSCEVYAAFVVKCAKEEDDIVFTEEVQHSLKTLWKNEDVQQAVSRSNEFHLDDSTQFFFENFDRVGKEDFVPTTQDILMARAATSGVVELTFTVRFIPLLVVDVGGQRTERKKWIHCFSDVNSIIFIVSLSEYNQKLREDESTNRMEEAMRLFSAIGNNDFFLRTPIMLFLNKRDIFMEKIPKVPLTILFPEYQGEQNYEESLEFLRQRFRILRLQKSGKVYTHVTCATDTGQMKFAFGSVFDAILNKGMTTLSL